MGLEVLGSRSRELLKTSSTYSSRKTMFEAKENICTSSTAGCFRILTAKDSARAVSSGTVFEKYVMESSFIFVHTIQRKSLINWSM